jgi:hypothetical protein
MAQSGAASTASQIRTIPNDYRLYSPLSKENKEFRIVLLLPGNEGDPLRCFFQTESLVHGKHSPYEALSYCWGSLNNTETIELYHFGEKQGDEYLDINGFPPNATFNLQSNGLRTADDQENELPCYKQDLAVTTNLAAALRKLRHHIHYRTLWVDAICINQGDVAERVAQVAIMRLIYEQAKQTLIWLGEGKSTCDIAMDVIYTVAGFVQEKTDVDPMDFFGRSGVVFDPRLLDQLLLEFEQSQGFDDEALLKLSTIIFGSFFGESWFRRVWVLQEVGTASRAVLRYGSRTVGWGAVLIAASWQKRWIDKYVALSLSHADGEEVHHENRITAASFTMVEDLFRENTLPSVWLTITRKKPLAETIFNACHFKSTDPRDMLYALVGLALETWDLEDASSILKLQYSNSPEEAFAVFTVGVIQATSSLNILSAATKYSRAGARQIFPSGRSWVPDFDPLNTVQCLLTTFATQKIKGNNMRYNACNGLNVFPVTHDRDKNILALHGYTIDVIDFQTGTACESTPGANDGYFHILPPKRADGLFRSDTKLALSKTLEHIRTLPANYPTGGRTPEKFVRTLQLGLFDAQVTFRDLGREQGVIEELTADNLMLHFLEFCHECKLDIAGLSDLSPQLSSTSAESSERFLQMIRIQCNGRCFFATRTGLMGLCPVAAKQGDCVVVLFGSPVPFVLRRIPSSDPRLPYPNMPNCFEFIGECYVEGKMDGSVVRDNMAAGRPPELFILA